MNKKKYTPSQKSIEARQKLIALSKQAKEILELIEAGEMQELAESLEDFTVNNVLLHIYAGEQGNNVFKTPGQWKKEGYKIKKGETAYRIWGKPIKATEAQENQEPAAKAEESAEERKYKFWPMACLFNINQVEPWETETPEEAADQTPGADPAAEQAEPETPATVNSAFVNQEYTTKQDGRRERLEERAAAKRQASNDAYKRSHELVEHIPMGQPILVGHHSERRHRATLDKSWNAMGKSVALDKQAENLESRASSVGSAGIASDDPEALIKLTEKLNGLEKSQETMKAVNKALRSGNDENLKALGFTEAQIAEFKKPDFAGRVGFASYSLQNNNAEIRRTQKRIEELKKLYNAEPINHETDDYKVFVDAGRVHVDFLGIKPSEEVRTTLKRSFAFKWSRYSGTWVRKATPNACAQTSSLIKSLAEHFTPA